MKNFILISTLVISSAVFAHSPAKKSERILLCNSVDGLLAQNSADMALDLKKCISNQSITSSHASEGIILVKGELDFNAPYRPSFKAVCELRFDGTTAKENIIGGLETEVNCNL